METSEAGRMGYCNDAAKRRDGKVAGVILYASK
jgi:hypothetical protein